MLQLVAGRLSDRRRRLFAVACCRRRWPLFTDERVRHAVEVAERYADGLATEQERSRAQDDVDAPTWAGDRYLWGETTCKVSPLEWHVAQAARFSLFGAVHGESTAYHAAFAAGLSAEIDALHEKESARSSERGVFIRGYGSEVVVQRALLRDIAGNPFRPPGLRAEWLTWNGGVVVELSRAIYEERAFDRLPVLADALEEAGCVAAAILDHCRQPAEHVRGCWVVDRLLGKK
jgi:hypothetical protein